MKKLKVSFLMLFGLAVLFTACNQNNVDPYDLDAGEQAVLDMVFLATTDAVPADSTRSKGKCNMTEVAIEDLPAAISSYISTNYEGSTVKRAGTNNETGEFGVMVLKADGSYVGVRFAADGSFIAEHVKMGKKGTSIAVEDLPAAVTAYITATYPDASIKGARQSDDGKIGVVIQLADESHKGLAFDAEGAFTGELSMKKGGKRSKR
jgi:hypothetical protein